MARQVPEGAQAAPLRSVATTSFFFRNAESTANAGRLEGRRVRRERPERGRHQEDQSRRHLVHFRLPGGRPRSEVTPKRDPGKTRAAFAIKTATK
jgi:hypothetical protein